MLSEDRQARGFGFSFVAGMVGGVVGGVIVPAVNFYGVSASGSAMLVLAGFGAVIGMMPGALVELAGYWMSNKLTAQEDILFARWMFAASAFGALAALAGWALFWWVLSQL